MPLHHQIQTTTLANGLTIIGVQVPGTEAVTAVFTVSSGTRNERENESGLAHFAEHMFFKGGRKYTSTQEISKALDGVGGEFNAFTSHQQTSYYTKTSAAHANLGIEVLADMLLYPRFPAEEVEKERLVVVEEINMYNDMPMRLVDGVIQSLLFGDTTALGRPILGSKESVMGFTDADLRRYHAERYVGAAAVLVLAGAVTNELIKRAGELFSELPAGSQYAPVPAINPFGSERVRLLSRESEQTHFVLTTPGLSLSDSERPALLVLSTLLGDTMSSRLFLRVREEQGLCYYVRSGVDSYTDTGVLAISAGVDTARLGDALKAICRELTDLAANGPTEEEVARAIQNRLGRTALAMEDSEQVAVYYSEQYALEKQTTTPAERLEAISRVSREAVAGLAKRLFVPEAYRLAVVGPHTDAEGINGHLG